MSRTRGKYKQTQEIIKEHNLHVLVYVSYTCKVSGKWGSENNLLVFLACSMKCTYDSSWVRRFAK